jgi:hypothetical protein
VQCSLSIETRYSDCFQKELGWGLAANDLKRATRPYAQGLLALFRQALTNQGSAGGELGSVRSLSVGSPFFSGMF